MREGFYIGPLLIHYYGVLISFGILAATWLTLKLAKRQGIDEEYIWDMLPWVVITGVIGARVWHILTPPQSMVDMGLTTQYYLTHPLDAIAIWNGGLGIPGAVIGGVLAAWLYTRKKKLSFLKVMDIMVPGLALAQAIGRWGNFINQELYGMPTNLPWAIFIEPQYRLVEFADQAYYHPLFLYESIANLLICGTLLWITLRMTNRKSGIVFQIYLILYPAVRFFLEFLRLDPSHVSNLNVNQTLMAVVAISSGAILLWRLLSRKENDLEPITDEDDIEPADISTVEVAEPESNTGVDVQEDGTDIEVKDLAAPEENPAKEDLGCNQDNQTQDENDKNIHSF